MQRKFFALGTIATTLLVACGPATAAEAETELTEAGAPAVSEQEASVKQEQGPVIQSFQVIPPQGLGQFSSAWPGGTSIAVQSYGANFVPTPVHIWCTTGSNNVYFTLTADSIPTFHWYCYGRTIYVRNQGTNSNQTIQATSW
jgi:hypothetical protein